MSREVKEQPIQCEHIKLLTEEYLADELDAKLREAIEDHVEMCSECRNAMEMAYHISLALRELPKPQPPPDILNNITAYVKSQPQHKKVGWLDGLRLDFRLLSIGALSICLIGIVLFGAYRSHQQSVEVERASYQLLYTLNMVRAVVVQTETAVTEHFPTQKVISAPRRALTQTVNKVHKATVAPIAQNINKTFPLDPVNEIPQKAVGLAVKEINDLTSEQLSRVIGGGFTLIGRLAGRLTPDTENN